MASRWCLLLSLSCAWLCHAAEPPTLDAAFAAARKGDRAGAITMLGEILKAKPDDARAWHVRAQLRGLSGDDEGAVSDLTEAIQRESRSAYLVMERAMLYFRRNEIEKALIDFDRANEIEPRLAAQNWQRGIALYYAGRFADGRRQFELHRTVNPDDVENAAWHFLCTAREKGVEEARKSLIPVEGDTRIPMKEVQLLFAGKLKPEDVSKAAETAGASQRDLSKQRFYARLYLGLYFEAVGQADKARENIRAAADSAPRDDYMGEVARVHARRLKQ
jgi:lipoprotein NlpI